MLTGEQKKKKERKQKGLGLTQVVEHLPSKHKAEFKF
jgi:hypothetical protein